MALIIKLDPAQIDTQESVTLVVTATGAISGQLYGLAIDGDIGITREAPASTFAISIPGAGWPDGISFQMLRLESDNQTPVDASNIVYLRNGPGLPGGPVQQADTLDPVYVSIKLGDLNLVDGTCLYLSDLPDRVIPDQDDDDYKVEGQDGVRSRIGKAVSLYTYGAGEMTLPVAIDGDYNFDGTINNQVSPQQRASDLAEELVRQTNGEVVVEVTRSDASVWRNTGRRVSKATFSSKAVQSFLMMELGIKFPKPAWTRVSADVIATVSNTGDRAKIIDELQGLSARITDAKITITCDEAIRVEDVTTGSWFEYNAPADGLIIDCSYPLDPLRGQGDFKAYRRGGGIGPLTIGDGKTTPAIKVTGGTAVVQCQLKSLIAF